MAEIKKRINIKGGDIDVHGVGYRPFLLREAIDLEIQNFDVKNTIDNDGKQMVTISMIGEEDKISEFIEFAKNNFPPLLSSLASDKKPKIFEDNPPEHVMPIEKYHTWLSVDQQNSLIQGGTLLIGVVNQRFDILNTKYGEVSKTLNEMNDKMESMNDKMEYMKSIDNTLKQLSQALIDNISKD